MAIWKYKTDIFCNMARISHFEIKYRHYTKYCCFPLNLLYENEKFSFSSRTPQIEIRQSWILTVINWINYTTHRVNMAFKIIYKFNNSIFTHIFCGIIKNYIECIVLAFYRHTFLIFENSRNQKIINFELRQSYSSDRVFAVVICVKKSTFFTDKSLF